MNLANFKFDLHSLREIYAPGVITPAEVVAEVGRRIDALDDPAVWIHRLSSAELAGHLERIMQRGPRDQPLYGVPFAIKDNIDLAGVPTTAGCPEFGYIPTASAPVVQQLLDAGAIPIGKTNLDQFATGLVGVRSPYGTPRNPYHPAMIPGGSSSGSAVAVAAGLVTFSLGTDTAGSGRVPASFNNLVGLKPTCGWLSTTGVVPACRSLDCVSIFAASVTEASAVAAVAGGFDATDPYAREAPKVPGGSSAGFRFALPRADQLQWFGDDLNPPLYAAALNRLESLGGERVEIDFTPFATTARLLYEGPWVAERWSAVRAFHATHADAMHPVTRRIIEGGAQPLAVDAFESFYRLKALQREAAAVWADVDLMVLPTAATIYTRAQLEADPITLNSNLGHYTNFANLLDTAALAIPAGFRPDGLPFGVTLFGPAWSDARLAAIGARFSSDQPEIAAPSPTNDDAIELAVVGAHLRGQPLNHQLTDRGATFVRETTTSPDYELFALSATQPPKPGLRHCPVDGNGAAIAVEIWSLNATAFGQFTAEVPAPLAIGTITLADGTTTKGFVCEPIGFEHATDITAFGGWRNWLASQS
ncbi:allophanate hydrolase [Synoicihabitans lomoniglobus]|uniref:Allophanate hydrolase n=1 Tax=Synoicihabitans lomoniglobus TaxID=2909285 RepID=A0AAF0CPZ4_9BACT|nr:allophanate hydrolase [Opitutaceae bacterium LMO-M01]WED65904.1 allophanate hydrolase [Opitutaceae bacterium LMO-M01]